jgi:hypothetical protein
MANILIYHHPGHKPVVQRVIERLSAKRFHATSMPHVGFGTPQVACGDKATKAFVQGILTEELAKITA